MDPGSAITAAEARAAAAEFLSTGQRPSGDAWRVVQTPTMDDSEPFSWDVADPSENVRPDQPSGGTNRSAADAGFFWKCAYLCTGGLRSATCGFLSGDGGAAS